MKELMKIGKGKRTYVLSLVAIILAGSRTLGYIDETTYETLVTYLLPAGLISMRMAISKKK